jgi:hypothetical protein
MECDATTLSGARCKNKATRGQTRCRVHVGPACSVCLTSLTLQGTRELPCQHTFHTRCVDRWKRSCPGDPTCPMCRTPFDVPTYRCRLIIERTSDSQRAVSDFQSSNVQEIVSGFGLDFRSMVPSDSGRFYTDIHFDIDTNEVLDEILRELGLPVEPHHFG